MRNKRTVTENQVSAAETTKKGGNKGAYTFILPPSITSPVLIHAPLAGSDVAVLRVGMASGSSRRKSDMMAVFRAFLLGPLGSWRESPFSLLRSESDDTSVVFDEDAAFESSSFQDFDPRSPCGERRVSSRQHVRQYDLHYRCHSHQTDVALVQVSLSWMYP